MKRGKRKAIDKALYLIYAIHAILVVILEELCIYLYSALQLAVVLMATVLVELKSPSLHFTHLYTDDRLRRIVPDFHFGKDPEELEKWLVAQP